MKKSKVFLSLLSIIMCWVLLFTIFSESIKREPQKVNTIVDGVKVKIYEFNENIVNRFKPDETSTEEQEKEFVYIGGFPVGMKLFADGVVIVDTESVDTNNGNVSPAEKAGLKVGDIIKKVNNENVESNKQVSEIIEKSQGKAIKFTVLRGNETFDVTFKSSFSVSENKYKAGMWIRDSSAGIGTVTFCTQKGYFASLGHAVCDIDTKQVVPISYGETTNITIVECIKGENGSAGEMCGYLETEKTGDILENGRLGVYGKFNDLPQSVLLEIADKSEVKTGPAEIYSTLENGKTEKYSVEITAINSSSKENKHLVIKVTDKKLIEKTGGIIQGMSGSPIVQNNKLVGAVTHVFLNDATGGFGIFAETMLEQLNDVTQN